MCLANFNAFIFIVSSHLWTIAGCDYLESRDSNLMFNSSVLFERSYSKTVFI